MPTPTYDALALIAAHRATSQPERILDRALITALTDGDYTALTKAIPNSK